MKRIIETKRGTIVSKIVCLSVIVTFLLSSFVPPQMANAQVALNLPTPGTMITPSIAYTPAIIAGMTIHPENPLQLNFMVDTGDDNLQGEAFKKEAQKMINYFLATLTVPDDEMWVNLSPYEEDRIIADGLSQTEMGRDMLVQDYMLKQLTASLMYPEEELGEQFWQKIYEKSHAKFGTTDIPANTFNKVWIVPKEASVYINGKNVFVNKSHLTVMLEEDYLALESNIDNTKHGLGDVTKDDIETMSQEAKEVIREVIIPAIEKEVNHGKNFANLRQIYHSMILATWYKKNLKENALGKMYMDQNKVAGIDLEDKQVKEKIYNQYLEAFQKGVYDYIKEDYDPVSQEMIPRKYFSGGLENIEGAINSDNFMEKDAIASQWEEESKLGIFPQDIALKLDLTNNASQVISVVNPTGKDNFMSNTDKIKEAFDKVESLARSIAQAFTLSGTPVTDDLDGYGGVPLISQKIATILKDPQRIANINKARTNINIYLYKKDEDETTATHRLRIDLGWHIMNGDKNQGVIGFDLYEEKKENNHWRDRNTWHTGDVDGIPSEIFDLIISTDTDNFMANTGKASFKDEEGHLEILRKQTIKTIVAKALDTLQQQDGNKYTPAFSQRILSNPYLLDNYRLFDLVDEEFNSLVEAENTDSADVTSLVEAIKAYYPDGKNTEFLNIYEDTLSNPLAGEPQAIGIGSLNHTHPDNPNDLNDPIVALQKKKGILPFVHAAATAFPLLQIDGKRYLLSTVRATTKKHGGKFESVSGGQIGADETIKSAITRELAEELGIEIENVPLVGYKRYDNKADDNTHDFVALVVLNEDQSKQMLSDLEDKNLTYFIADSAEQLEQVMPDNISKKTGTSPKEYTANLKGSKMAGGKEIAYAILAPFNTTVDYYNTVKNETPQRHADIFAWVTEKDSKFVDGNFLGNDDLVKSAVDSSGDNFMSRQASAMPIETQNPLIHGGIDFNPNSFDLQQQGQAVNLQVDDFMLRNIQPNSVGGIIPNIISISPLTNFAPLIGLTRDPENQQLSQLN